MKWTRTRTASALAVGTASALLLSACNSSGDPSESEGPKEPVTISVSFWGNFGLESLKEKYEAENPHVTIELITDEYGAAHDKLTAALNAGSGAANVSAIDEGFITQFVSRSDDFVNLLDLGAGQYKENYLPWKWAQAANGDESVVIGLGSDVGGLAMCYRHDLFEAAGLPTDRDEVSAAIGDSWSDFIALGQQYVEGSGGKKFVDNATNVMNPALTQLGTGQAYYNRNNELDMDSVKPAFDTALAVIDAGLSANIPAWSTEWNVGFANGDFATLACPAWMMGYIQGQITAVDEEGNPLNPDFAGKWDVADIPGPGGNWGGSFYTVPKQGTANEQQEAYNFVEWLIQADQQIAIFQEVGNLPSQSSLYENEGIQGFTNAFFNDAPVGAIFSKTAADIPGAIYYGPNNQAIRNAVEAVLNEVQAGTVSIADAWSVAVERATAADSAA